MNVRRSLTVLVPAAALLAFTGASVAYGQEIPYSMWAAELNAGTASTGIGPNGRVGAGISAVMPESASAGEIEIAGVQTGYGSEAAQTQNTQGEPHRAALLNAGTVATGMGPDGQVGSGIQGAAMGAEVAGVQLESSGFLSYVQRLRQWTSAGFRIQPGHIKLFSMNREQMGMAEGNVEVAGVQLGDVNADGAISYQAALAYRAFMEGRLPSWLGGGDEPGPSTSD